MHVCMQRLYDWIRSLREEGRIEPATNFPASALKAAYGPRCAVIATTA